MRSVLNKSNAIDHSRVASRPVKEPMGKFHGEVDPYGPYAIVSSTSKKRETLLTPSDVGSQSPAEEYGLNTTVTPKPSKGVATTGKVRPIAHDQIGVQPERTITAHPASTKPRKKRLGATYLGNAQENS